MGTGKEKIGDPQRESPRVRVLRWLEDAIKSGRLPRGAELPTEREIAKIVGVATCTAALAMDEAEARGLAVRRHPGARRRYAGTLRGDSLAASTVFVLARQIPYPDIATAPSWSDSFLALDVVRSLSLRGRSVALYTPQSLPAGGLDAIFEARPGGMVVTGSVMRDPLAMEALARCREAGIPAVAYGNSPELRGYDRAYSDHRTGSRELTRWLLARGCRRIVPFFPFAPTEFWGQERLAGYEEAMREAGLEPAPCKVFGTSLLGLHQISENFQVFKSLAVAALVTLKRDFGGEWPDALLCLNDDWTWSAQCAIQELGLVPNRDILVAGYDNMVRKPDFEPFEIPPPIVTIDKHNELASEGLASLLLARMGGSLPPEPQVRIHKHELVEVAQ